VKVALIYVFPNLNFRIYEPMARRFTESYMNHPTMVDHELYVIINGGGPVTPRQRKLFDPLQPNFLSHDNSGRDIGAYIMAARTIDCDLMVCLGTPVRPVVVGWLDMMVDAVEQNGPGIYGCWGFRVPTKHLRTTAFWITPQLLTTYPHPISTAKRYFFEHSRDSITHWCISQGFAAFQVTRRGIFPVDDWHHVEAEDCLLFDQHTDRLNYNHQHQEST